MGGSRLILFLSLAVMAGFAYFIIQWTNNEIANLNSGAASNSSYEAESGVLSGNISLVTDASASSGKYMVFSPPNMLTNPGFESGTTPWYVEGSAAIIQTDFRTGLQAMRLGPLDGYSDQPISLQVGATYTLSAWGKYSTTGESNGTIGVVYRDSTGARLSNLEPLVSYPGSTSYSQRSVTFTVPSGVASMNVYIYKPNGTANFYLDDFILSPQNSSTPTPTTSQGSPTPTGSSSPTPTTTAQRTLYVSPTGSDTNPGTQTQPWKSFFKAAATARAGDLVLFMDGTFIETQTTKVINAGTASNPIIFRSQNPQKAVIYYQNMSGKWRMDITGKQYVHIENFEITGDNNIGNNGVDKFINYTDGSDYGVIRGNKIHNIYEDLVKVYNADYMLVEDNILSDVTNEGFDVMNSIGGIFRNNTVINAHRQAFMIKGGMRNTQIYNNTVIQDSGSLYVALGLGGSSDNIYAYDDTGYEGYHLVAWNNVVVAKNGGVINEALKFEGCDTCAYFNNVVVGADKAIVVTAGPGLAKNWTWDVLSRDPVFKNNILMDCRSSTTYVPDTIQGTLTIDYNDIFNCSGAPTQAHGVSADPLFVNKLSDWHLQSTSPAKGKGVILSPFPTFSDANTPATPGINVSLNRDGQTRVTPWNIGAY